MGGGGVGGITEASKKQGGTTISLKEKSQEGSGLKIIQDQKW